MYVLGQQDPFMWMNVVRLGGHTLYLFFQFVAYAKWAIYKGSLTIA